MGIGARPWRCPTCQSLKSCAGVILTHPVPKVLSTYASAMTGIVRPVSGSRTDWPTRRRVAFVVGIHRDRDVAQHRLRPGRRDHDVAGAIARPRVADLPDLALLLVVLDLEVRHRRAERRVPVDEALAAIDETVVEEADERLQHGGREPRIHREALARPVAGRAEPAHLVRDRRTGRFLPRPDAFGEFLAAEVARDSPCAFNCCSTTICVAMPAWSVPSCHSVLSPRIRWYRISTSISVIWNAWPMCSVPVTFGGGSWMQNAGAPSA